MNYANHYPKNDIIVLLLMNAIISAINNNDLPNLDKAKIIIANLPELVEAIISDINEKPTDATLIKWKHPMDSTFDLAPQNNLLINISSVINNYRCTQIKYAYKRLEPTQIIKFRNLLNCLNNCTQILSNSQINLLPGTFDYTVYKE